MDKVVITYGTFDMFHVGHLRLLKRLEEISSTLIVAVSTDEFNKEKGKESLISFEHRAEIIEGLQCVDLVIPEYCWEQKITDIKKYDVDIFSIGDDWLGRFDYLNEYCEVVYMPRTLGVSTTELKKMSASLGCNVG